MLDRKPQVAEHQKSARSQLAARLELLKAEGKNDKQIQKDPRIKQIRAEIGKAKKQMAAIGALETLLVAKAEAKAQKKEAAKVPRQKPKKSPDSAAPKKPKREKKPVA
jgi:hypothetical protein